MRINQFIAHAGICARRAADQLIKAKKIHLNGTPLTDLSYQVQPDDIITYQGKILKVEKKHYLILNKPEKYLTTVTDPYGKPTVMDLIKLPYKARIYPVGRLDFLTTGLLILTNDGPLASKLAHPSQGVTKTYQVTLDRALAPADQKTIAQGVRLPDGPVPVDDFRMITPNTLSISIHIGRNRVVRRLFKHFSYDVTQLKRTHYGPLTLKNLKEGQWRTLSKQEVKQLQHLTQKAFKK